MGAFGSSRRQFEDVFKDLIAVPISMGTVVNLERETTTALVNVLEEPGVHVR